MANLYEEKLCTGCAALMGLFFDRLVIRLTFPIYGRCSYCGHTSFTVSGYAIPDPSQERWELLWTGAVEQRDHHGRATSRLSELALPPL